MYTISIKEIDDHSYPLLLRRIKFFSNVQQSRRKLESVSFEHENDISKINRSVISIEVQEIQIVIPTGLRRKALQLFQNMYGHPGVERTKRSMRKFYYWPTCRKDVADYVSNCIVCKLRKVANHQSKPPIMIYDMVTRPWERTHLDLAGPFNKSGF